MCGDSLLQQLILSKAHVHTHFNHLLTHPFSLALPFSITQFIHVLIHLFLFRPSSADPLGSLASLLHQWNHSTSDSRQDTNHPPGLHPPCSQPLQNAALLEEVKVCPLKNQLLPHGDTYIQFPTSCNSLVSCVSHVHVHHVFMNCVISLICLVVLRAAVCLFMCRVTELI